MIQLASMRLWLREGISEQNPDQSEIEKDDYENGTAKRQRKKLF